jgi:hypothetical protein
MRRPSPPARRARRDQQTAQYRKRRPEGVRRSISGRAGRGRGFGSCTRRIFITSQWVGRGCFETPRYERRSAAGSGELRNLAGSWWVRSSPVAQHAGVRRLRCARNAESMEVGPCVLTGRSARRRMPAILLPRTSSPRTRSRAGACCATASFSSRTRGPFCPTAGPSPQDRPSARDRPAPHCASRRRPELPICQCLW